MTNSNEAGAVGLKKLKEWFFRRYESEYNASHLSPEDFSEVAKEVLDICGTPPSATADVPGWVNERLLVALQTLSDAVIKDNGHPDEFPVDDGCVCHGRRGWAAKHRMNRQSPLACFEKV